MDARRMMVAALAANVRVSRSAAAENGKSDNVAMRCSGLVSAVVNSKSERAVVSARTAGGACHRQAVLHAIPVRRVHLTPNN